MTRFVDSLTFVVVAASAFSAADAAAPARYTISAEQISIAICNAGMPVLPAQVKLLTQARATTGSPRLKVESIQRSGNNAATVRMGCADSAECLPFFVNAELKQNDASETAPSLDLRATSNMPRAASKPTVIRAGSPAVLLLESERVHIRIPVVCIENGAVGAKIHVRASASRQLYVAEVVDATSLKGSL